MHLTVRHMIKTVHQTKKGNVFHELRDSRHQFFRAHTCSLHVDADETNYTLFRADNLLCSKNEWKTEKTERKGRIMWFSEFFAKMRTKIRYASARGKALQMKYAINVTMNDGHLTILHIHPFLHINFKKFISQFMWTEMQIRFVTSLSVYFGIAECREFQIKKMFGESSRAESCGMRSLFIY